MREPVVTACHVGKRILKCSKFCIRVVNYAQTVRELVVKSSGRCVPVPAISRPSRIVHKQVKISSRLQRDSDASVGARIHTVYRASWALLVILPFASEDKMGRVKQIRSETNRLEAETTERDNLP